MILFGTKGKPTYSSAKKPLPYDAEVEYLQSTGSQWIDTLVTLTGNSKIEVDFIGLGLGNKAIFGADNGQTFQQGEIALFWNNQNFDAVYPSSNSASTLVQPRPSYVRYTRYVVSYDKTNLVVNGSSQTSGWYADYAGTRTLFIFATNRGSAVVPSDMQLFSFKIYTGSTLVRDMIPVRFTNELGQSEGAMYDRVSGILFGNDGTGAFLYGGDVYSVPVETSQYVQDGLVAMWDGKENVGVGKRCDTAMSWVDLVGGRDATLSGTYSWGANYWHVESISGQGLATWPAQNLGDNQTIEFVIDPIATSGYGRIIGEGQSVASPIYRTNGLYVYGYGIDRGATLPDIGLSEKHIHQITHPSGGPMKYYIDGVLLWTSAEATGNSTGASSGYFANRSDYGRGIDADYFTMRRYNRVLTDAELATNYAIDKARFNLP